MLQYKMCDRQRRFQIDAALKDNFFLRVLAKRLLNIRSGNIAQSCKCIAAAFDIRKHVRARMFIRKIAGKEIHFAAWILCAQLFLEAQKFFFAPACKE